MESESESEGGCRKMGLLIWRGCCNTIPYPWNILFPDGEIYLLWNGNSKPKFLCSSIHCWIKEDSLDS